MHLSIHPSTYTHLHRDYRGHFLIPKYCCLCENVVYLIVRLYATEAHFSSCQDSVASSRNESRVGVYVWR